MKNRLIVLAMLSVFSVGLVSLHQKVKVYVQAYKMSSSYRHLDELVDQRDHLVYTLSKKISVAKLNQWANDHDFAQVEKEKVVALQVEPALNALVEPAVERKFAFLFDRFLDKVGTVTTTALAQEFD